MIEYLYLTLNKGLWTGDHNQGVQWRIDGSLLRFRKIIIRKICGKEAFKKNAATSQFVKINYHNWIYQHYDRMPRTVLMMAYVLRFKKFIKTLFVLLLRQSSSSGSIS